MPYYPKQGAILPDNVDESYIVSRKRRSKTVWDKLYKNFFLRRKSPSYSVNIRDRYYIGHCRVMCRDKWSVPPISNILQNEIVLEVQGRTGVLDAVRSQFSLPQDNIIGIAHSNGVIALHKFVWYVFKRRNEARKLDACLCNQYTCVNNGDWSVFTPKDFTQVARQPVASATTAFNEHMNQWRV